MVDNNKDYERALESIQSLQDQYFFHGMNTMTHIWGVGITFNSILIAIFALIFSINENIDLNLTIISIIVILSLISITLFILNFIFLKKSFFHCSEIFKILHKYFSTNRNQSNIKDINISFNKVKSDMHKTLINEIFAIVIFLTQLILFIFFSNVF